MLLPEETPGLPHLLSATSGTLSFVHFFPVNIYPVSTVLEPEDTSVNTKDEGPALMELQSTGILHSTSPNY